MGLGERMSENVLNLPVETTPALTDVMYVLTDPSGSPIDSQATLQTVSNLVRSDLVAFVATASATLANSTAEATILGAGSGSLTLAAGYLNTIGKSLHVRVMGIISNTGTPTFTVKMKFGSTVQASTGAVTTPASLSNSIFVADFWLTCITTGVTGTVRTQGTMQLGAAVAGAPSTAAVTNDLTGALVIDVTGQWSAMSVSNTITVSNVYVEKVN